MLEWKSRLNTMIEKEDQNIDEMANESSEAKTNDVGLINNKSGAGLLARDTGVLEAFSYYNLGFRFDPENMSLSFYAPHIKMFTGDYQIIDSDQVSNPITDEYQEILKLIGGKVDGEV